MLSYIKSFFQEPAGQIRDSYRDVTLPAAEDIRGSIELDPRSAPFAYPVGGFVIAVPPSLAEPQYTVSLTEDGVQRSAQLSREQVDALVEQLDNQVSYCGKVVELPNLDSFLTTEPL